MTTARSERLATPAVVARIAHADLRREWRSSTRPSFIPFAKLVSKHTPSVRTSPVQGRKKSLIWGMCCGPPPYYNLINRQAGCPSSPSEDQRSGFAIYETTLPAVLAVSGQSFAEPRHDGVLHSSLTGVHFESMMLFSAAPLEEKRNVNGKPGGQGDDGLATPPIGRLAWRSGGRPFRRYRHRYDSRSMLRAPPLRPGLEPLVVYCGRRVTGRSRGVDHVERVRARPASFASRPVGGLRRFVHLLVLLALPTCQRRRRAVMVVGRLLYLAARLAVASALLLSAESTRLGNDGP